MVTRAAVQALPRAFYEETIAWIDTTSVNTGWMFEVRDPSGGRHMGQSAARRLRCSFERPRLAAPSCSSPLRAIKQYLWQVLFSVDHSAMWPWSFLPLACRCYLYNASCDQAWGEHMWEFKCQHQVAA